MLLVIESFAAELHVFTLQRDKQQQLYIISRWYSQVMILYSVLFFSLQDQIKAQVDTLLKLKADYKSISGEEWKAGSMAPVANGNTGAAEELNKKITEQGNKVRTLKGDKADKVCCWYRMLFCVDHWLPCACALWYL